MSSAAIAEPAIEVDTGTIERFLKLLHPEGYFEISVPDCPVDARDFMGLTQGGRFNDHAAAASEIRRISALGPEGVYVSVNPAEPVTSGGYITNSIGRGFGSDIDTLRRDWLAIVITPTDDTNAEVAAHASHDVIDWLASRGWPDPVRVVANTVCLLYRCDLLGIDHGEEIRRALRAVSTYCGNDQTKISDAERVLVAGSVAWIGTNSVAKKHMDDLPRYMQTLAVPEPLRSVSHDMLRAVADEAPPEPVAQPVESKPVSTPAPTRTRERVSQSAAPRKQATTYQPIDPGTLVKPSDRDNIGTVTKDKGDSCEVHIVNEENGKEVTKTFPKSELTRAADGSRLDEQPKPKLKRVSMGQLIRDNPEQRPAIIEGILRKGETMNVIASTKVGKSHLTLQMAYCIADGRPWMDHATTQGKVLILDNELHADTLAYRGLRVATDMFIDPESEEFKSVEVVPMRGHGVTIDQLEQRLEDIKPGEFQLIIIDALYRAIPAGVNENDNNAMMQVFNNIDQLAKQWDCAIALVHHSSKGEQGGKRQTDVGSGAGSISRAADSHLTLRDHAEDGHAILETSLRSWAPIEPKTLRWEWPLWQVAGIAPKFRDAAADRQKQKDDEIDRRFLDLLAGGAKVIGTLRSESGCGADRATRCIARLLEAKKIKEVAIEKKTGYQVIT